MIEALLGFAVGYLIGLTGVGGGSLLTPSLVMLGVEPVVAVGTDLVYATLARALGVAFLGMRGRVRRGVLARLIAGSVPAVLLGRALLEWLPRGDVNRLVAILLGAVLVATSLLSLLRDELRIPIRATRRHAYLAGFVVGLTVQFTSVGAGVLVSFALVNIARLDPREAVGTVLGYGLALGALSALNYASLGLVDYRLALLLSLGGAPGVLLGAWTADRANPSMLRRLVNALILLIGLFVLASCLRGPR